MPSRPSTPVRVALLALLAATLAGTAVVARDADWNLGLLGILLLVSVVSDLRAIEITAQRVKASGSFLAIIVAAVLLGAAPAVLVALTTILASWLQSRYAVTDLLVNAVVYATFPLLAGVGFALATERLALDDGNASFYLLVFGIFVAALIVDFFGIAAYTSYVEGSSLLQRLRRSFAPMIPTELAAGLLALGITFAYNQVGLPAAALFAIVLLCFQFLVGELLLSQERADELERRAHQLAGFQFALLGALLRTLDLRDRMTARHSASVARYSRELAAHAGLPEESQNLVHTAALLHDIGKFVLPDRILKASGRITLEDWDEIRRHPAEGARIVSQIDGYAPVADIILAHHERYDGLGYPYGTGGEAIPELARIISIADTYDVITARDTYTDTRSSSEAIVELRRVAGSQLDPRLVEVFIAMLSDKSPAYRHGEDVNFEEELALEKRVSDYIALT